MPMSLQAGVLLVLLHDLMHRGVAFTFVGLAGCVRQRDIHRCVLLTRFGIDQDFGHNPSLSVQRSH